MIVGYGAIVGLTSLGFNGVLGGRTLYGGPSLILAAGMLVAVIAGVVGGYIAGKVIRSLRNQVRSPIDREESSRPSESCSNCAW